MLVSSSGLTTWTPIEKLTTNCDIVITYYPFDSQRCNIELASGNLNSDPTSTPKIKLFIHSAHNIKHRYQAIYMDDFDEDALWEFVDYKAYDMVNTNYSYRQVVRFSFLMRRRPTFYILCLILPVLFLSLTATLVFALPPGAGEKMGTSITVLLAFSVYLTLVTDYLPDTSLHISLVGLYLTVLLGICSLSVVVTAFILRIHHTDDNIPVGPSWLGLVTCFGQRGLIFRVSDPHLKDICSKVKGNGEPIPKTNALHHLVSQTVNPNVEDQTVTEPRITWTDVSSVLDWMCFLLFSLVNVFSTVGFGCILMLGAEANMPSLEPSNMTAEMDLTSFKLQ